MTARTAKRALDLGCGGHSIFQDAHLADHCFGADSQTVSPGIPIVVCRGEKLPFADSSFDLIVSRVAIPYMKIPRALREIHRVMTHGGRLWATLHLPMMALRRMQTDACRLDLVDIVYQLYAISNWYLLCISSVQIPWFNGRFESVQTPRSISIAISRAGFINIQTEVCTDERNRHHFATQAYKP